MLASWPVRWLFNQARRIPRTGPWARAWPTSSRKAFRIGAKLFVPAHGAVWRMEEQA
jgi:hypothetical protein